MITEKEKIGENIRIIRKSMHLTQNQLCEKVDISRVCLSNIENGTQNMSITLFVRIIEALQVDANTILGMGGGAA